MTVYVELPDGHIDGYIDSPNMAYSYSAEAGCLYVTSSPAGAEPGHPRPVDRPECVYSPTGWLRVSDVEPKPKPTPRVGKLPLVIRSEPG